MRGESASPAVHLQDEGESRTLRPAVFAEVMAVALEAINNALRHAQAENIVLEVDYRARALKVSVRDDGCGLPADFNPQAGRAGHWGLRGMYERARLIKGQLCCESQPGCGTSITLNVPAASAYEARKAERATL